MKIIQLTQGKTTIVSDKDYKYLSKWKWQCSGKYATRAEYNKITKKPKTIYMHRVILGLTNGKIQADHINNVGLDNRRENLRKATSGQNRMNRGMQKSNNTSGYKGVVFIKQRNHWIAKAVLDYKIIYFGSFKNKLDAAKAYNNGIKKIYKEFAKPNII